MLGARLGNPALFFSGPLRRDEFVKSALWKMSGGFDLGQGMDQACLYLLQGNQVDFWLESSRIDDGEEDVI